MPELYNVFSQRQLEPGDVVMVVRKMRDKRTNKSFDWRFFMVVTEQTLALDDPVEGWVLGTTSEHLKGKTLRLHVNDEKNVIHYLSPDEWPDGVHQFRMALIMQRKIENL